MQDRAGIVTDNIASPGETSSFGELQVLIENLKLHQIELEMQNDELRSTQANLELLRQKYFELYDLAPVGYVTMNPKGIVLEINLTAANLLGVARNQLISKNLIQFIAPDYQNAFYFHCHAVLRTGKKQSRELKLVNKDGGQCFFQMDTLPIRADDGAVCEFRSTMTDISRQKAAADALLKSEAQKRTILDVTTDLIHYIDNEMKLIWVNKAVLQEYQVSMEHVIGRCCYRVFHHRDSVCDHCPSVKARQTRRIESAVLNRGEEPDVRHWDVFSAPLLDEREKVSGLIQIARDITANRKAEQSLRESEARFRHIIENAPFGYYRVGKDGLLQYVNPEWKKMYGYASEEIIGKNFENTQPVEFMAQAREMFFRGMSGETLKGESRRQLKNSAIGYHAYSIQPVRENGEVVAVEGFITDITRHKQAEERIHELSHLLIRTQEKERHLISCELHDSIAQNLSVLKINCDSICNDPAMISPALREKLEATSSLLVQTISAVRNLAYDLRLPGLDEMGLVKALEIYCEEASENGKIRVDFQSAGISVIGMDEDMEINIYRLIQEGLNNIRKHADADQATILLLGSSPNIILRIEDNGRGFDVKEQELLSAATKRMGIRSMQERVNLLQGRMSIQSQPMKGTKIFIKIPLPEKYPARH